MKAQNLFLLMSSLLGVAFAMAIADDTDFDQLSNRTDHALEKRDVWPTGCVQAHCLYTEQKEIGMGNGIEITVFHNGQFIFDLNGPGDGYLEWAGVRDKAGNQVSSYFAGSMFAEPCSGDSKPVGNAQISRT